MHLLNGGGAGSPSSSGSYGHLSTGAISPALAHSAHLQLQAHLIRSASTSPFLSPQNSLTLLQSSAAAAAAAAAAAVTATAAAGGNAPASAASSPYYPLLGGSPSTVATATTTSTTCATSSSSSLQHLTDLAMKSSPDTKTTSSTFSTSLSPRVTSRSDGSIRVGPHSSSSTGSSGGGGRLGGSAMEQCSNVVSSTMEEEEEDEEDSRGASGAIHKPCPIKKEFSDLSLGGPSPHHHHQHGDKSRQNNNHVTGHFGTSHMLPLPPGMDPTGASSALIKDEPDFIETTCKWIGCDRGDLITQDALVKVSTTSASQSVT